MWAIQSFTYHKPRWIVFLPIWSSEERLSSSLLGKATQFMQVCWQEAALYGTMWRGTKDQKKTFCHLGMRKGCFLSCQAKNLLIRPAICNARGEISLIQLSTPFSLSTLVIRKGAIISQFMRPTRPADAQSLASCVVFAFFGYVCVCVVGGGCGGLPAGAMGTFFQSWSTGGLTALLLEWQHFSLYFSVLHLADSFTVQNKV